MSKIIGLTNSDYEKNRTALIFDNGAVDHNGYVVEGEEIVSISNQGETAIVITKDRFGNKNSEVIRLSDGALLGRGSL